MAEGSPAERTGRGDGTPPLRLETVLLLVGLSLLLVFVALEPFLSYALFGSDTGEYAYLTQTLATTGSLPRGAAYAGWGSAYPDFPGTFLFGAGGAGALNVAPFTALTVLVPTIAALSVVPLFLLLRRLYPNDAIALLGAAFGTVAMPRMFSLAHPAPLALGDFLLVAAFWMLVESRRDRRWYALLLPTAGALIVTHHLSSYFFAIGGLGGILLLELWRPGLWSRRFPTRELLFLGGFLTATFLFWFYGTEEFVAKVLRFELGGSPLVAFGAFEGAALLAVALTALCIRWRRGRPRGRRAWVRLPSDRSLLRDAGWIAVAVFGLVSFLLVVPIPGTEQKAEAGTLLWFSPVLGLGLLCAGSRRTLSVARLGPLALTWLGILGLSAATMLLLASVGGAVPEGRTAAGIAAAIAPDRHVEYLFLPLGLLVAVGAGRLVARAEDRAGRRALAAGAIAIGLLLAANAAIVYPPQTSFGGFEEGLTRGDAALWMWVGIAAAPGFTVASDHRLSSMLFGFDGDLATWVTTPALFTGANRSAAMAELRSAGVPNPAEPRPIELVAIDAVMFQGVALDPAQLAEPISANATLWFELPAFVPLYENGAETVYLVDAPLLPP